MRWYAIESIDELPSLLRGVGSVRMASTTGELGQGLEEDRRRRPRNLTRVARRRAHLGQQTVRLELGASQGSQRLSSR
jgi:hypothetical protein